MFVRRDWLYHAVLVYLVPAHWRQSGQTSFREDWINLGGFRTLPTLSGSERGAGHRLGLEVGSAARPPCRHRRPVSSGCGYHQGREHLRSLAGKYGREKRVELLQKARDAREGKGSCERTCKSPTRLLWRSLPGSKKGRRPRTRLWQTRLCPLTHLNQQREQGRRRVVAARLQSAGSTSGRLRRRAKG